MQTRSYPDSTRNSVGTNWPAVAWRFGGVVAASLVAGVGLLWDSPLLTLIGAVLFTLFALFWVLSMWAIVSAKKLAEADLMTMLAQLSQTRSTDTLAVVDLGRRWPANLLSKHLTSGRLHVVDVYNPQQMPARSLSRERRLAPHSQADPRVSWYDSDLNLLPLPDGSVTAVFLVRVLSEIAQEGDQIALLREVRRILQPKGRLLIAEATDAWVNRLLPGSGLQSTQPAETWYRLAGAAGFEPQRTQTLQGLMMCLRADKPSVFGGTQLALDLSYETLK